MDFEAEYNNRALVPGHPAIIARWFAEAEAAREIHPPRERPYGASERGVIDLTEALVLSSRVGETFTGVLTDVHPKSGLGTVQFRDPAVELRLKADAEDVGTEIRVRVDAVDVVEGKVAVTEID